MKENQLTDKTSDFYFDEGLNANDKGNYGKAILLFKKAIQLNPNDDKIYVALGISYSNLFNFHKAIDCFDKAITINHKNYTAFNERGIVNQKLKKYINAIDDFDDAIKANPDFEEAYENRLTAIDEQKFYEENSPGLIKSNFLAGIIAILLSLLILILAVVLQKYSIVKIHNIFKFGIILIGFGAYKLLKPKKYNKED